LPEADTISRGDEYEILEEVLSSLCDGCRLHTRWEIQSNECKHLEEMRLHHVTDNPYGVKISDTITDVEILECRYLDTIDLRRIDDSIDDTILCSEREEGAHTLFPHVVIEEVELIITIVSSEFSEKCLC